MKTLGKLSQITILSIATAFVVGCGGGGDSSSSSNSTISHNGVDYKTVKSPTTGRVWLDRNLGAARVCTVFNDTACYGDYYQWGRNADGHQDSASSTTTARATNVTNVGHPFFIKGNSDWAKNGVDNSGATRVANWSKTDGSSVCPVGFRVPTKAELSAEFSTNNIHNRVDAFNSFLKLPSAGVRLYNGAMYGVGSKGAIYTATPYSVPLRAYDIYYTISQVGVYHPSYTNGLTIRCIKAQ